MFTGWQSFYNCNFLLWDHATKCGKTQRCWACRSVPAPGHAHRSCGVADLPVVSPASRGCCSSSCCWQTQRGATRTKDLQLSPPRHLNTSITSPTLVCHCQSCILLSYSLCNHYYCSYHKFRSSKLFSRLIMHIIIRQKKQADHSGGPLDDSVLCPQLPQLSEWENQCYIKIFFIIVDFRGNCIP